MNHTLPLIRAAAITPMRRWIIEHGRKPAVFLAKADLDWVPSNDPYLPIPLRSVVRLLLEISRDAGADAPHRIVNGRGGQEIGLIGAAAFCGPTVRDGFRRLAQTMPVHCTHEVFTVANLTDGLHIRDGWAYNLGDDEALHLVQQYVASLVDMICSVAHGSIPCVDRVALVPHPDVGLSHLRPWLGKAACPAANRALDIILAKGVADARFPEAVQKAALDKAARDKRPLSNGRSLSDQVATLVESMLSRTTPSVDRMAAAASVSGRTLRRSLQQEGTSFSAVVERTRARIALARLKADTDTLLKDIATDLGYADQATLTRAVNRWTGQTPRTIRKGS